MKEIASYKLEINKTLLTKDIMEIYQFAIQKDINIYLYHKDAMADAWNLPELLSFFFVNPHEEILLIIEGWNALQAYKQLQPLFGLPTTQIA